MGSLVLAACGALATRGGHPQAARPTSTTTMGVNLPMSFVGNDQGVHALFCTLNPIAAEVVATGFFNPFRITSDRWRQWTTHTRHAGLESCRREPQWDHPGGAKHNHFGRSVSWRLSTEIRAGSHPTDCVVELEVNP